VTFPRSLDQVPAATPEQWPGVNGTVQYSEGLQVGYRWYDAQGLTPLFPFGYGLSYTTFQFSNLRLSSATLSQHGQVFVMADVTNTGSRPGAEVAQLYLTLPSVAGEPDHQLKGFTKVFLQPGQTKQVQFTVSAKDASYWDTPSHTWMLAPGSYTVSVGDSSRSLPLNASFDVTHPGGVQ
jgi:beta-glucosidase